MANRRRGCRPFGFRRTPAPNPESAPKAARRQPVRRLAPRPETGHPPRGAARPARQGKHRQADRPPSGRVTAVILGGPGAGGRDARAARRRPQGGSSAHREPFCFLGGAGGLLSILRRRL